LCRGSLIAVESLGIYWVHELQDSNI
jgi:hypothetical protein